MDSGQMVQVCTSCVTYRLINRKISDKKGLLPLESESFFIGKRKKDDDFDRRNITLYLFPDNVRKFFGNSMDGAVRKYL